jgi:hypothetical protein
MADVYGAITSTEGAPTPYELARVDALERELADVEHQFATLTGSELQNINTKLKAKSLPAITVASEVPLEATERGGRIASLFAGMVGSRYVGPAATAGTAANDER